MRRVVTTVAIVSALTGSDLSNAQSTHCEPGPLTLAGASDVILSATPLRASLRQADDMVYVRGVYRVVDVVRGELEGGEVEVEFSCADMANPVTNEPDLGHCPGSEGATLPGFERDGAAIEPLKSPLVLYLSRPSRSPLDGKEVHGAVVQRPFVACADEPRSSTDLAAELAAIRNAGSAVEPSSPLTDYDAKVGRKEAAQKPAGGCN